MDFFKKSTDIVSSVRLAIRSYLLAMGKTIMSIKIEPNSSIPTTLTNINGTLYLSANNGTYGIELWESDGTAAGTVLVEHINRGSKTIIRGTWRNDTLQGTVGSEIIYGAGGNDSLIGLAGRDQLNGGGGNDTLTGGDGKDRLWGGNYDDILNGGLGSDLLSGGNGDDTLIGGSGSDRFIIHGGLGVAQGGTDTITDFTVGEDLILVAHGVLFAQLTIAQGTGGNANDTLISWTPNNQVLAILSGVEANTLTSADFVSL